MKNEKYNICQMHKHTYIVMHKTQHRRRHRHRRTRRGGAHSTAHAASAAAAGPATGPAAAATPSPQLQAILANVRTYAATTPAPSSKKVNGISKSQASQKRFQRIMKGTLKQTNDSSSKYGRHNRPAPGQ